MDDFNTEALLKAASWLNKESAYVPTCPCNNENKVLRPSNTETDM